MIVLFWTVKAPQNRLPTQNWSRIMPFRSSICQCLLQGLLVLVYKAGYLRSRTINDLPGIRVGAVPGLYMQFHVYLLWFCLTCFKTIVILLSITQPSRQENYYSVLLTEGKRKEKKKDNDRIVLVFLKKKSRLTTMKNFLSSVYTYKTHPSVCNVASLQSLLVAAHEVSTNDTVAIRARAKRIFFHFSFKIGTTL